MKTKEELGRIATILVDAIVKVHRALGPGLLESAYQACLAHEIRKRGIRTECEQPQPVTSEDLHIDVGYRVDMLIEEKRRLGFLINWNVPLIKDGINRMVNHL